MGDNREMSLVRSANKKRGDFVTSFFVSFTYIQLISHDMPDRQYRMMLVLGKRKTIFAASGGEYFGY